MAFRAAALTGARSTWPSTRPTRPAPAPRGRWLGNSDVSAGGGDRIGEELGTHAARLAAAGCELILRAASACPRTRRPTTTIPRWCASRRRAAVVSGAMTQLLTWAVIPVDHGGFTIDGESAADRAHHAGEEGAQVVVLEIPMVEVGLAWLDSPSVVVPRSASPSRGGLDPDAWAREVKRLLEARRARRR